MADGQHDAQPRTLKDYVRPIVNDNYKGIKCQTINANNFELKPALINRVQQAQFSGSPLIDPNIHLAIFLEIYDIVKINGVTEDTIRLRLFPFSLRDKARGVIFVNSRKMISSHSMKHEKVYVASSGTLMSKTAKGATSLLEEMSSNNYQWPTERTMAKKVVGIYELEPIAVLSAQVASLSHQISVLTTQRIPQSAEYVTATSMTNVLQPPPRFGSQPSEKKMSLEDAMVSFVEETKASNIGATVENLEVQIGQLAKAINAQQRGFFPSNTKVNPNEQCKTITLRSGREIERSPSKETKSNPKAENNGQSKNKVEEEEIVDDTLRETDMSLAILFPDNPPILSTPLPYPQNALEQMPNYVKVLKDIISKKRWLKKLVLGEMKQTTISLQLANRSIKYPHGIIEDVLVKVD
ncbi:uncharacterized protein [Aristolochia californica]|uniref:uncharacterized protein n=1 Tax=Aristolochia californica TaxID=171875 RepID=UPI0035DAAF16